MMKMMIGLLLVDETMRHADLRSRYLNVQNPTKIGFWQRLRLLIAGLIYPEFKHRYDDWCGHYFTQQYMLSVHKHYENECRQLNKSIIKKHKQIIALQAKLAQYE